MRVLQWIAVAAAAAFGTGPALAANLEMQSAFHGQIPILGSSGVDFAKRVDTLTGGELKVRFRNPGELVAESGIWDAVSTGAVDAGWYSLGFAEGSVPSAPLFASFPFGPDVREYTAWWYHGGGKELWADISAPSNVHAILCGILVPEGSGWYRSPVDTLDQLKGKKVRMFGLGATVLQKLGVSAQSLTGSDTMAALNLGTIDAAEISFPAIDYAIGMHKLAEYYYFPGWHQQTSMTMFIINRDTWDGLDARDQAVIEEVCAGTVARTMAQGEAVQIEPLEKMIEEGVKIKEWSPEMLAGFRAAWAEVVEEKSAQDEGFRRTWQSLEAFSAKYQRWSDLGYLDSDGN